MKKIILALMIVVFSGATFAEDSFPSGRTAATPPSSGGNDPNGDGVPPEETPQAGVTKLGAGTQQPKVCEKCQESNTLLSSNKRKAQPGVQQATGATTPAGTVDSSN